MKKELNEHKLAYAILASGLLMGVACFMIVWPDRVLQRIVAVSMCGFYILWGVITHLHTERISKKVIAEYVSIASLAGFVLLLLTV